MKFKYKDQVRIKAGFFEGCVGIAKNAQSFSQAVNADIPNAMKLVNVDRYQINIDADTLLWLGEDELELVEDLVQAAAKIIGEEEMPSDEQMLYYSTDAFDEYDEHIEEGKAPEVIP